MTLSSQAEELKRQNKLLYGDPCGQPDWDSTTAQCRGQGSNLAVMVLQKYGIPITGDIPENQYSSCCPLDILNQDPYACIRMSLSAMLLDGEYWECFADEFGFARFQRVLQGSSASSDIFNLKNVQFCLPSVQVQSLVDMVVVRAADPPAFRQCGDWINLVDGGNGSIVEVKDLTALFEKQVPGAAPSYATGSLVPSAPGSMPVMGLKFTWGQVTSTQYNPISNQFGMGTDSTCDTGTFSQHGGVIYPDYERKQGYKDGVNDVFEVGPHMNILFWMIDTDLGSDDPHFLRHYSVQFHKSSEFPVYLDVKTDPSTSDYFGPSCIIGADTVPDILIDLRTNQNTSLSCESVAAASQEARNQPSIEWGEYALPLFFGYGKATSKINFTDISKWDIGSNICFDNQLDNMYESTSALLGNGAQLMGFTSFRRANETLDVNTPIYIGVQQESKTFDIPNNSCWVEMPTLSQVSDGLLYYALRAQAPHVGTYCKMRNGTSYTMGIGPNSSVCWGDNVEWMNCWWNLMFMDVGHSWPQGLQSMSNYLNYSWMTEHLKLRRPGKLMGIDGEGLFTVDTWWAKINISRPGLIVTGKGKDVKTFLEGVKMRVMPVYLVDMPPPTAAYGNTGFQGVVNPDTDVWDNMYCTAQPNIGDTEKLQDASEGVTMDYSFPFLFPNYSSQSSYTDLRASYDEVGQKCLSVAQNLFGYFDSFRNEPNKSMSYICSPPRTQAEVPKLGQTVTTPYGPRTINSISFQYTDSSSFNMTVDVGNITLNPAAAGGLRSKRTKTESVEGRVVSHDHGSLFRVRVPGIGIVNAWNAKEWPWEVGDKVQVQLYNNPEEI
jgi:hypothetical protein